MLEPLSSTLIPSFPLHSFTLPRGIFHIKFAIIYGGKCREGLCNTMYSSILGIVKNEVFCEIARCFLLLIKFLPVFVLNLFLNL